MHIAIACVSKNGVIDSNTFSFMPAWNDIDIPRDLDLDLC
jgi:hypothetical protein